MVVGASIHTHTHTHASPEYLTDTQREGLSDLHRAIKGMLTFNLVAVDLCRRIFVRGRSRSLLRLPSHSLRTRLVLACQLRNLFVTHFCSALFYVFLFLFFGLRFSLLFVFPAFSAFWGQAFPSRQKNPNMFTRDLWRGIFVYVAFLRRRLRLFRRLCFASGSPRLRQVYLGNSFQKQQLKRLQMEVC